MEENFFNDQEPSKVNLPLNSTTGGFSFSILVLIYFIIQIIASVIISVVTKDVMISQGFEDFNKALQYVQKTDGYIYTGYLLSPFTIILCTLIVIKFRKVSFKQIFPVKTHPKYFLIAALLVFGLLFSLSWTNEVSVEFFKLFGYKPRENSSYFPDLSGGKLVFALLVMAVFPAFFEELLFRGLILNSCENGAGTVRTVFITGFCFSLFHGSPEQTVYQFIAGCAFALIALRSRSILPSVMMHFINNALIVIFGACGLFSEEGNLIISSGVSFALFLTSAISLVGALVWLILDKTQLKRCEKGGVKTFFAGASGGIAILGIVWILSLFGVS